MTEQSLLNLLQRPYDPQPPASPLAPGVSVRFGGDSVADEESLPALGEVASLPRGTAFSVFLASHRRIAAQLCHMFMQAGTPEELVQIAAKVRDHVSEQLFVYALSFAILRRKDLRNMRLPTLVEVFPHQFVPQEKLMKAQIEIRQRQAEDPRPMVVEHGPEFSGSVQKPEHRVNYWREDYGMNNHHWHWHLIYPISLGVNRDRKGEIFYYMHQQMLARYDMERLSVGLNRVIKFENWREPIPDGYFCKLTVGNSGRNYGTRQDNTVLQSYNRPVYDNLIVSVDIVQMEAWRTRIMDAIHRGYLVNTEGQQIKLSDDVTTCKRGVDLLGDVLEADLELSVNPLFYGDLHNEGHVIVSVAHDPYYEHQEELGPIGFPETSALDPAFYRWHKFVDDVFQQYKETQPPYPLEELEVADTEVAKVSVVSGNMTDTLTTGWNAREFEASQGIDFYSEKPVMLRLTHLDHLPFQYHISVNNGGSQPKQVTVRIFIAPKYNSSGKPMGFLEQRLLWTEMDKFTYALKPGANHITRNSDQSSITNRNEFTFRDLENRPAAPGTPESAAFDFCGCGWPQHLLLPRGRPGGMTFQLFVLLSDYEKDRVDQDIPIGQCTNGVSYCGILDAKFPDRRPMGFPFDRLPLPNLLGRPVTEAADYARLDNAFMHEITIKFTNEQLKQ